MTEPDNIPPVNHPTAPGERRLLRIVVLLAAGIATMAFGLLALLGWIFEWPRLADFGAGWIPMAPSTAALFLLYGAAICVRARVPLSRRAWRISVRMVGGGMAASLLIFTLGYFGILWSGEHLFLSISGTVGGAAIGHMSPITSFCFLLASVSFLTSISRSALRRWRTILEFSSAGVLLGIGFAFLLAYFFGAPLFYDSTFIPPALNTILAFISLGLALMALTHRPSGLFRRSHGDPSQSAILFALIFLFLALGIIATGYAYYRNTERHFIVETEQQLSAIADLKAGELVQWRQERLGDAGVLFNNASFSALVRRFLEHPEDPEAQLQVWSWLNSFHVNNQYDECRLLDAQGIDLLSVPPGQPPLSAAVARNIAEVLRLGQAFFQDFYLSEQDQRVHLGFLIPILDIQNANQPLAVLFMRLDPATYLYPFIQRWPTPSPTAETLLIRRDGNDALFLNELRFQTNSALNLRISLENTTLPAVMAVLGQEGIVEGRDYRDKPVLASVRAIPDSPWFLVARRDMTEVYAPLHALRWQVFVLIGGLLFSAGAGVGLVWRQQSSRFYRAQAETGMALAQSARELQEKNVEMERFLYTVSHDLKSPIVTVQTFLGYLEQDMAAADAGRIEKDMGFIRAAADKVAQQLDEVLEMSRIGRVAAPRMRIAFREVVDEALAAVAGSIAERGVQVQVAEGDLPLVGDRGRLVEIWQNLLENAVKFMGDQPSPQIEIGMEMRNEETVFFVRDNGIGIDPRFQAKIFGLFEKLDAKGKGMGMGLAIVQRIVGTGCSGRIWVESAGQGQGAGFYFTLPGAVGGAGDAPTARSTANKRQ